MAFIISKLVLEESLQLAEELAKTGGTVGETPKTRMFVVLDGSPEYYKRLSDTEPVIFHTFEHGDRVFHIALT